MKNKDKEKEEPKDIMRSYPLKNCANNSKIDKVKKVFKPYRKTAKKLAGVQWKIFFQNGCFHKNEKINHDVIKSKLSARYQQTCQYQVVGMLKSHIINIKEEFVSNVNHSKLDDTTKLHLFFINKYNLWHKNEVEIPLFVDNKRVKGKYVNIPIETIKLARKIFNHIYSRWHRPSFNKINMVLDAKVAKIKSVDVNKKKAASEFDYWVTVSTLVDGDTVCIPLQTYDYFESIDGERLNSCQLNLDKDRNLEVRLIKKVKPIPYEPEIDKIFIDIGLNIFIATNKGDLFGRSFYDKLKKFDTMLQNISVEIQKGNKKLKEKDKKEITTRRYKAILKLMNDLIKNEVNRIVNRMVEIYKPAEIVKENLNFIFTNLSNQTQRIIRHFGKQILEDKFKSLTELYGIKITEVNPAYTSRECSCCGYVDKRNRKGEEFKCLFCGHTANADVDGAKTVESRSSDSVITVYSTKEEVLQTLVDRFISGLERQARLNSKTLEWLKRNPYFTGAVNKLRPKDILVRSG